MTLTEQIQAENAETWAEIARNGPSVAAACKGLARSLEANVLLAREIEKCQAKMKTKPKPKPKAKA
jgi:hypothetical protein